MNAEDTLAKLSLLLEEGNVEGAMELKDLLDDMQYSSPEFLCAKAILSLANDKPREAERILLEGARLYPQCADLYYNLGFIYFESELYINSAICSVVFCRYADKTLSDFNETVAEIERMVKEVSKLYVAFNSFRKASSQDFVLIPKQAYGTDSYYEFISSVLRQWGTGYFMSRSL